MPDLLSGCEMHGFSTPFLPDPQGNLQAGARRDLAGQKRRASYPAFPAHFGGSIMNNALTVVGYVSQSPKIKRFASGKQCVEFSLAVKEWELDENGENRTLFLDVKAFNGVSDRVLKTITKGREVVLNGRLGVESFTSAEGKEISKL